MPVNQEAHEDRGWYQRCGLAEIVGSNWGVRYYHAVKK